MIKKVTLFTISAAILVNNADYAFARRSRIKPSKATSVIPITPMKSVEQVKIQPPAKKLDNVVDVIEPEINEKPNSIQKNPKLSEKPSLKPVQNNITPVQSTKRLRNINLPVVNMNTLPISYSVADRGEAGLAGIELYYTINDGKTWTLYGKDIDAKPPFDFNVLNDAQYGFYTVAIDKAGNMEPAPMPGTRPQVSVIVDRQDPTVKVIEPATSSMYNAVDTRNIRWQAEDLNFGQSPITIQVSTDGGNSWSDLANNLPNTGFYAWKPEGGTFADVKLRIIATDLAGNPGVGVSGSFLVDGIAPITAINTPTVVGMKKFKIPFTAFDKGGSGISTVELWYKLPNKTWQKYASTTDLNKPFDFESPIEGYVDFVAVGIDKVGNSQKNPSVRVDLANDLKTVAIDLTAPEVALLALNDGGVFQGGSVQTMRWLAKDSNLAEKAITLQFSSDGGSSWRPIGKAMVNSGNFAWVVPNIDTDQAMVKITAVDQMGNTRSVISKRPFIIDSTAPESCATFNPNANSRPKINRTVAPKKVKVKVKKMLPKKINKSKVSNSSVKSASVKPTKMPMAIKKSSRPIDKFLAFDNAFSRGDLVQAQMVINTLVKRYPNDAGTWMRNGDLMARKRKYNRAVFFYTKSLQIRPYSIEVLRKRGTSYYQLKEYTRAIDDLKKVVNSSGDAGDYINLGIMNFKYNRLRESKMYLKRGIQAGGSSPLASWYLAKIAEKNRNYRLAVSYWEEVERLSGPKTKFYKYHNSATQFKNMALKKLQ